MWDVALTMTKTFFFFLYSNLWSQPWNKMIRSMERKKLCLTQNISCSERTWWKKKEKKLLINASCAMSLMHPGLFEIIFTSQTSEHPIPSHLPPCRSKAIQTGDSPGSSQGIQRLGGSDSRIGAVWAEYRVGNLQVITVPTAAISLFR